MGKAKRAWKRKMKAWRDDGGTKEEYEALLDERIEIEDSAPGVAKVRPASKREFYRFGPKFQRPHSHEKEKQRRRLAADRRNPVD